MDPLPSALFRREMGWPLHKRPFDYTKVLASLHINPADSVVIDPPPHLPPRANADGWIPVLSDDIYDDDGPIYNMDYGSGSNANMVGVGYESGRVCLVDTSAEVKNRIRAVHACHTGAIFTLNWSTLKPHQLVTGSSDQNVRVWDCTSNFQCLRDFRGHSRTVKKVTFHPSQPDTLASASRDGAIRIWDLRSRNEAADNYITYAHSQLPNKRLKIAIDTEVSVTDLLFQDDNTLISCGSHDGFIKFWDLRKTYKQLKKKEPVRSIGYPLKHRACVGYSSMCIDQMNNLFAASASREIFKFNLSSEAEEPCFTYENNDKMNFEVKVSLSSCGRYLGSGSRSEFAHIWDTWNTTSSLPVTYLETEANLVVFCPADPFKVVTGGDDGRVLIWNPNVEKLHQHQNTLPDKFKPPTSSIPRSTYLQCEDKVPLHPRYKKVAGTERNYSSVFDLSSLITDLPNAVIDGNYSNTRLVTKWCHTPKRRSSILSMIQSTPTSRTSSQPKRSSPVSSRSTTPKVKRRKSIRSDSPSSIQPKIISFLQPFSQTAV